MNPRDSTAKPLSASAQLQKELREQAAKLGLRQISIYVPCRDYARTWNQLGPSKTNIRCAIAAEKEFQAARACDSRDEPQLELVGLGGGK